MDVMPQPLDKLDDKALVALALENRQEAYTRLLVKYKDRVRIFIGKLIINPSEADDLVLMSFDKAFSNLKHYNPKYAFSTWLYSIVQHLCIDHYRKNKLSYVALEDACEATEINPEEGLIMEQQRLALEDMIARLKPEYAQVIRLRYVESYTYEEIANVLNIPLGTVKTRLHRAKYALSQTIAKESNDTY